MKIIVIMMWKIGIEFVLIKKGANNKKSFITNTTIILVHKHIYKTSLHIECVCVCVCACVCVCVCIRVNFALCFVN